VKSHPTVLIPFDDRVIFVRLLHCAEFSRKVSPRLRMLRFCDYSPAGKRLRVGRSGAQDLIRSEVELNVNLHLNWLDLVSFAASP
jgi:hypothetical protein